MLRGVFLMCAVHVCLNQFYIIYHVCIQKLTLSVSYESMAAKHLSWNMEGMFKGTCTMYNIIDLSHPTLKR